jgi:hypothetical protein
LDDASEDAGAESAEPESDDSSDDDLDSLLDDASEDIDSVDDESSDSNDDMDSLMNEDESSESEINAEADKEMDDMLGDLENSDRDVDELLNDVTGDLEEEVSLTEVMSDIETDSSEEASLTEVMSDIETDASDEDEEEAENLSDLLSEVTGREISDDDLENVPEGESVSLDELVQGAEDSLSTADGEEVVRVLSQSFRLEKAGDILYEGEDEAQVKVIVADHVMAGDTAELTLVKVAKKEVVKVVSEEVPISISIKAND